MTPFATLPAFSNLPACVQILRSWQTPDAEYVRIALADHNNGTGSTDFKRDRSTGAITAKHYNGGALSLDYLLYLLNQ
jgi:hypothetical protein